MKKFYVPFLLPKNQKTANVWKKDVWDFEVFSQTFLELRFSLGNEGEDGERLNSQTWPGTPRRPSSRHPRPPDKSVVEKFAPEMTRFPSEVRRPPHLLNDSQTRLCIFLRKAGLLNSGGRLQAFHLFCFLATDRRQHLVVAISLGEENGGAGV